MKCHFESITIPLKQSLHIKCLLGFVCFVYPSQSGAEVQMLALNVINKGSAFHRHHTLESANSCRRHEPLSWSLALL